jgi:hypothetical protein
VLSADPPPRDKACDQPLAFRFAEPTRVGLHTESFQGFPLPLRGKFPSTMLRKLMWTLIYGLFGALAALAARIAATRVYRLVTGEEPPVKK